MIKAINRKKIYRKKFFLSCWPHWRYIVDRCSILCYLSLWFNVKILPVHQTKENVFFLYVCCEFVHKCGYIELVCVFLLIRSSSIACVWSVHETCTFFYFTILLALTRNRYKCAFPLSIARKWSLFQLIFFVSVYEI